MYSPFLRQDDPRYAEVLTDAAVHVLLDCGVAGFSIRALARWMKVTPAAVLNTNSRARVIEMVTISFCRRWLLWIGPMGHDRLARLPQGQEEVAGVRVYLALHELARGERSAGSPAPGEHLAAFRTEEHAMLRSSLRRELGREVSEKEVQSTAAIVMGLRVALADDQPALTWESATWILRAHVDGLAGGQPAPSPSTPPTGIPCPSGGVARQTSMETSREARNQ